MSAYADILAAASQLSVEERVRLIDELWETIPEEEIPMALPPEWLAEIERRTGAATADQADDLDWQHIRSGLFRRLGADAKAQG